MSFSQASNVDIRRWELPQVGDKPLALPVAEVPDTPPQPTVRELEAIEQQAREEGYANGLAEGLAEAQEQTRQRMAQLDALLESAVHPLQAMDEQTEQALAQLAVLIARRVIDRELATRPELIAQTVKKTAAMLPAASRDLQVYLHPDDLALMQLLEASESHWQLLADPAITRGGCRLQSERSRLDAQVETRLAAVIDAVLDDDELMLVEHDA